MNVLGLMTGTSADAIDVALCQFAPDTESEGGLTMRLIGTAEEELGEALRCEVLGLMEAAEAPLHRLVELNVGLGDALAAATRSAVSRFGLTMPEIDLVASHGQTIYHLVEPERLTGTWQMGEGALISATTGITTVTDFRAADMAAGGQGAPLAPFFDALFFHGPQTSAVQNIGGMANVTFLPAGEEPYAFDTGPGNALIDYAARHFSEGRERYDRDGDLAAAGEVDETLLADVLDLPYFAQPPPKSTGREIFGDVFAARFIERACRDGLAPADIVATLTALTAESIARAYRRFGPQHIDQIVLGGGGARNRTLIKQLHERLPNAPIRRPEEWGLPADAKEAVVFALLGYEAVHGRPANLPRCTGARRRTILGKIVPGDNYVRLMHEIWTGGTRSTQPTRSLRLLA